MKKTVSIIGGGPTAFLLAAYLDTSKYSVTIYEKNKTAGRKFLVAGKGGFNLTHSESITQLIERYTPSDFLEQALTTFSNVDFSAWLDEIGIPTYVGSSKRVFPKEGIKPIEVLQAILKTLQEKGVTVQYEHTFTGWDNKGNPIINKKSIEADYTVFALGGGSWKVTGSDGNWLDAFAKQGVKTNPFQASNCAFQIDWKPDFISHNEGMPLKNIAISCDGKFQKGEAVITAFGLEGNAIYGLSPQIRAQLASQKKAIIHIDFKPMLSQETVLARIEASRKNTTQILKKELKLSTPQIELLKAYLSKDDYLNPVSLAKNIKCFPAEILNTGAIDEAISTIGGIALEAVSEYFEIKKMPNQYCIGEMLGWDAPTGGYLLQGCASTGVHLAHYLNDKP